MTNLSLSALGQTIAAPAQVKDNAKLEKVAKSFEAVFVRQLIGSMRQGGFGDELMGNSGVDQFQEMADARTADTLAEHGGLGIAELLLKQLSPAKKAVTGTDMSATTTAGKPE